ncbi:RE1-silencing transcription factor [Eucyclogobius newberryi]|uniref:RE1-silencing transcription factor n=1 Tax=Eucyclogobius newberryi TaxID=166745 RepID=UPI003B594491
MSLELFSSPVPQLVMLANVAAVTADVGTASASSALSEGGGVCSESGGAKEMMELKTVGGNFSDDEEDDSIIRYSYDDQSQQEVCIVEYPESPAFTSLTAGHEEEMDTQETKARDLTPPTNHMTPPSTTDPAQSPEKKSKKKPFHCKPCNFQVKTESEFVEHLQTHAVSKMLVVNKVEGRSHRGKEAEPAHEEPEKTNQSTVGGDLKGLIRCERCGYNTNRYDHYISHLKHHSKDQDHRVFKCTLCPYTTVSQYHWRKHLRNHFPSKLHTCSQCSYFSDRKSNYIQHIRTHTGVRPFQCPYCDYSSSQKTHLTRHMRTHSGERPFKCESCNYLAANQHEVTRHARQVHNGPKPLACPYCDYKTADRSNFKKHVELHLNPRQFNCPLCKYAASKKCNLQYHIKSRHAGCEVNLDVSKVKLRVKKADLESRGDRSADEDSFIDLGEDLNEDFGEKEPASPINLSVKNKKPQEATKKYGDNGKTMDKKLKQKKIVDFVKAVERMTPKKRCKKVDTVQHKSEEKEDMPKIEDSKGAMKKDKKGNKIASVKVVKAKLSKRKAVEVLDLSQKVGRPAKMKKVKEMEEKPKKKKNKKGKQNTAAKALVETDIGEQIQEDEFQKEVKESTAVNSKHLEGLKGDQETEVLRNVAEKMEKVPPKELSKDGERAIEVVSKSDTPTEMVSESICESSPSKVSEEAEVSSEEHLNDKIAKHAENAEKMVLETVNKSPKKGEKSQKKSIKKKGDLVQDVANKLPNSNKINQAAEEPTENLIQNVSEQETNPTEGLAPSVESQCSEKAESPTQTLSPSKEVFLKPSGRPPLFLQRQTSSSGSSGSGSIKATECEEDEGIHEGASDVSDSASECSDDSGLKMLTPTDDIPTPTELKTHLCIFCDRTFPFKSDYQRHLNRHLVNVYYMDHSKASK